MMQLLQERNFSAFFTDTFQFIKENFVHLLTNYLIVNGLFLLLQYSFSYMVDPTNLMNFGPVYFLNLIISLISGFISVSFMVIYMILYNQHDGNDFNYKDIFNYYGQNLGKIILFLFLSLLMAIPFTIIGGLMAFVLSITVVGIILFPLLIAFFILWFALSFYEFLYSDKGYFDAMGYGFSLFMKKFWATTGSTALVYLIIFVIVGLIVGAFGLFGSFAGINFQDPESVMEMVALFRSPGALLVSLLYTILVQFAQVNPGIIYFSQKEAFEGIKAKTNIDDIGKTEI